jgi:Uma2 family endonuclease
MMAALLLDSSLVKRLKKERALTGADRFDEVWDGVYVMAPIANNEHQYLAIEICMAVRAVVKTPDEGLVFLGVNVSDREDDWTKNYRCPDVAVFLKGNPAEDRDTHWFGGPDFAVEILSPGDRSRKKLSFYASVGVRELLIVDRKPWRLELYRLKNEELRRAGGCTPEKATPLNSDVLPLRFALARGKKRPELLITSTRDGRTARI